MKIAAKNDIDPLQIPAPTLPVPMPSFDVPFGLLPSMARLAMSRLMIAALHTSITIASSAVRTRGQP